MYINRWHQRQTSCYSSIYPDWFLKLTILSLVTTDSGKLFQLSIAQTGKEFSLNVLFSDSLVILNMWPRVLMSLKVNKCIHINIFHSRNYFKYLYLVISLSSI